MKKFLIVFISVISLFHIAQAQKEKVKEKIKGEPNAISYPYTAAYSSQFQMGNTEYSGVVLNVWKGYDNNTWDVLSDRMADTATAWLADGSVIKGKDNILNGVKGYRGSFTSVNSIVEAWLPLKSVDRNDQWVCIWGMETDTKADGSTQKIALHELWRFNKDGKVDYLRQFSQQMPKD